MEKYLFITYSFKTEILLNDPSPQNQVHKNWNDYHPIAIIQKAKNHEVSI